MPFDQVKVTDVEVLSVTDSTRCTGESGWVNITAPNPSVEVTEIPNALKLTIFT